MPARIRYLGAVVSGFVLTAGLSLAFTGGQANAVAACLGDGDYAAKGGRETGTASALNARGTRAKLYVPSGGVNCQHIASIYVGRSNGWAEFGFVRGWSNCTVGGADDTKYGRPTLFAWYRLASGQASTCKVYSGQQPAAGWHTFRISDTNGNYEWGPWFNGNELETSGPVLDFNSGVSYVAMERGEVGDPGTAHWRAINEYTGSTFNTWDGQQKLDANHGPGSYNILSNNEGKAVE